MSLMINQNITSLNAWRNLGKTDREMSKTMEKLSSGLRINRAADDPSGLIISEQMRAQVVGLHAAVKNSEKGISMIQTAEGALDKVHGLLDKMRGLALDSANAATADANMLAANQAELDNIIDTITRIAEQTQYGTKKLLDGTNALTGEVTTAGGGATAISNINLAAGQDLTTLDVNVTATVGAASLTNATGATLADQGALALGDYTLTLDGQYEQFGAVDNTGMTDGAGGLTAATSWFTGDDTQDGTITVTLTSATDNSGGASNFTFTVSNGTWEDTFTAVSVTGGTDFTLASANADDASSSGGYSLDLNLTAANYTTTGNDQSFTFDITASTATATLSDANGTVGTAGSYNSQSTPTATEALGGATFDLTGITFDDSTQTDTLSVTAVDGFEADLGGGTAVAVTDNSSAELTDLAGNQATVSFGTLVAGETATFTLTDNSLVFQVGANQGQTVKISIQDVSADTLATNVVQTHNSGFANLSEIKVDTSEKATDAIGLIDKAIDQISVIRGDLGAFQANTLEANLDSLRVAAENLQASESVIRDTDMAAEMATFTKYQIMMQAGTAMLAQANQMPQNILQLLQG